MSETILTNSKNSRPPTPNGIQQKDADKIARDQLDRVAIGALPDPTAPPPLGGAVEHLALPAQLGADNLPVGVHGPGNIPGFVPLTVGPRLEVFLRQAGTQLDLHQASNEVLDELALRITGHRHARLDPCRLCNLHDCSCVVGTDPAPYHELIPQAITGAAVI